MCIDKENRTTYTYCMRQRPSRQKITYDRFMKLFYHQRLPAKELAKIFHIALSSIGSFRHRHRLPPRGRSPFNPKRILPRTHPFKTGKFVRVIFRKYPLFWNCEYCQKDFPNRTGHPRRFCSYICYYHFQKGKLLPGTFLSGSKHWRWQPDRSKLLNRHFTRYAVWTYKERNKLLRRDDHRCQH